MSETNFFGLSRGSYDPLAGLSRPLTIPERPVTPPPPIVHPRESQPPPRPVERVVYKSVPDPVKPTSETTPPVVLVDDLLNDFIDNKPKVRSTNKAKKALVKLKQKMITRKSAAPVNRQTKITKVTKETKAPPAAKTIKTPKIVKVPKTIHASKPADFTAQALTVAANTTVAANSPTTRTLTLNSDGEAAMTKSENRLPRFYLEVKINKQRVWAFIRTLIVVSILAVSGYLVWDMWLANQIAPEALLSPVSAVAVDEILPPNADVTSISNQAWAAHTTPADQARYLYLPSINARARVMSVGINSKGKIDAPKNVNDVAWYDGSAKPGREGQVFISGHSSFAPTYKAAFDNLSKVQIGDHIIIERGDGKKINYRVVNTETIKSDQVNMKKVLNVPDDGARGLTLMGCTGAFNYRTESSDMRIIIYAVQE
ncbi:class F sortase [Candidatus Saccharibacteria bacterium]|nr:class F sortase [Candidatus Saccharibacteria bacterium]